ncbi:hypothetical protein [Natronorubrum sp. DTA28]|uniref:hypothetical protein n=1 Tax=Natronorubrum sp. DTA28 TaxID=3447019 RepID=UPI003F83CEA8
MDTASDGEKEFENLVAERSENWVWQDAALEFAQDFNHSLDMEIADLKDQMESSILSDWGDLEQTIVDNHSTELVQLIEMFSHLEAYGHEDDADDIIRVYQSGRPNNLTAMSNVTPAEDEGYDLDGSETLVNPFSEYYEENQTDTDDIIYVDYERVDGTTFEAAFGWGAVSMFAPDSDTNGLESNGEFYYYDDEDGITDIVIESVDSPRGMGVPNDMGGSDYEDGYIFADARRRGNAVETIRSEAESLASEVSDWVDAIANEYARGELPESDVVSASRLREEYGYEEGNASITALYGSQLGFETDLKGTISISYYDDSEEIPEETDDYDDNSEYEDIETMDGYLMADHADDGEISLDAGESYTIDDVVGEGDDGQLLLTRPSGDTVELEYAFTVDEIRSYEDGEQVQQDSFTAQSYNFSPRDPNRYEEDVADANDAREDATQNPEFDFDSIIGTFGDFDTSTLLLLGVGTFGLFFVVLFVLWAVSQAHPAT